MKEELNLQTAKIEWKELQRHFAQGVVVVIEQGLDLVTIAADFVDDNAETIAGLMKNNQLRKAEMDDASRWDSNDAIVWAVVVAPWVLVQEINE